MQIGREIKIKNYALRNLRNNLRKILLVAVSEKFNKLIDLGEIQLSSDNWVGVQTINKKVDVLYNLLHTSICRCHDCRSTEKDAVLVEYYSILNLVAYPPFEEDEFEPEFFWLCPECYQNVLEKNERYKREGYYYLRDYDAFDTLEGLGIDSLEDLDKLKEDDE